MAKIAGRIYEPTRIIVIDEEDWSIEYNDIHEGTEYEITGLTEGPKTVIAQATDDFNTSGRGHVWPVAE